MTSWPDYLTRETLAKRMDLKPGAIDQLVKRGLLPEPIMIGEAPRWRWADVEARLAKTPATVEAPDADPYSVGARRAAEVAASRRHGQKSDRPAVLLPAQAPRNRKGGTPDKAA